MRIKDNLAKVKSTRRAPKLHGHTKITLTNPDGSTEIIEKDNVVTNWVQNIFNADVNGVIDYSLLMPLTKMFSGCYLFNAPAGDVDENSIFIPKGSDVTAHAGDEAYVGLDPTHGNPNLIESGEVTNGYRFVFDWQTSQGNGTFNTVGLTSGHNGNLGRPILNDLNLKTFDDIGVLWGGASTQASVTEPMILCQFWDFENNKAYHVRAGEQFVEIDIYSAPFKTIGLLEDMINFKLVETIVTDIGSGLLKRTDKYIPSLSKVGDVIYLVSPPTAPSYTTIYEFNLVTRQSNQIVLRTTLPALDLITGLEGLIVCAYIDLYPIIDGYVYYRKKKVADDAGIRYYKVNLNNSADVKEITAHEVEVADWESVNGSGGVVLPNSNFLANNHCIFNDEIYPCNKYYTTVQNISRYAGGQLVAGGLVVNHIIHRDDRRNSFKVNYSLPIEALSTINRLEAPIVKGADQTMKLEYTITVEE